VQAVQPERGVVIALLAHQEAHPVAWRAGRRCQAPRTLGDPVCRGGAGPPCRKVVSADAFQSLLKSDSNQEAPLVNVSRLLAAVTRSSSAPHATPMLTKLSRDRCWLMRPSPRSQLLQQDTPACL